MRLNAFAGCAQREKILSLNSLCVREAVSGRRWAPMRLNAFAGCAQPKENLKLKFAWCSRGCFGREVGAYPKNPVSIYKLSPVIFYYWWHLGTLVNQLYMFFNFGVWFLKCR